MQVATWSLPHRASSEVMPNWPKQADQQSGLAGAEGVGVGVAELVVSGQGVELVEGVGVELVEGVGVGVGVTGCGGGVEMTTLLEEGTGQ